MCRLAIAAFAALLFASPVQAENPTNLVMIGDSHVAAYSDWKSPLNGYGARLTGKVANLSQAGIKIAAAHTQFVQQAAALNPARVVIILGTNDLNRVSQDPTKAMQIARTAADQYAAMVNDLKARTAKRGTKILLVMPPPPIGRTPVDVETYERFRRLVYWFARNDPRLQFLDFSPALANEDGLLAYPKKPNDVHLSTLGYRVLFDQLADAIVSGQSTKLATYNGTPLLMNQSARLTDMQGNDASSLLLTVPVGEARVSFASGSKRAAIPEPASLAIPALFILLALYRRRFLQPS